VGSIVRGLPASFWWLWASTLVNRFGTFVVPFLAVYLTTARGYSAAGAGLVLAAYGIGGAAGALLGGESSDRIGRRPTMWGGMLLAAVATAVMGFATDPIAITVLAFAMGVTGALPRPAFAAMVVDTVPPERRTRAFAMNYWAINLGFAFSIAVAGFLSHHGYLWLFLADAGTTLLCALLILARVPETRPARPAPDLPVPSARTGLRNVFASPRFLVLCCLGSAVWAVFGQSQSTLPIVLVSGGISTQDFGLLFALNGLVVVALQLPVTARLHARPPGVVLAIGAVLIGAGFGLTGIGSSVLWYGFCVVIWTLGEICYAPAASAAVAAVSPDHAHGRYQGIFTFGTQLALILAPAGGGLVLDRTGATVLWSLCAVVGVVAAAGFLRLFVARRPEHQPARQSV
jgi:MFS family permease